MSEESKKIDKKRNAMKHGVYSREVMLPGEKRNDYEALRSAHYDEYTPDGITEECLVDDVVKLRWRKRRVDQYIEIRLQERVVQSHVKNEGKRHKTNLKNLAAEFSDATSIEAVEKILAILSPWYGELIMGWVPRENYKNLAQWGPAIGKFLSELKTEDPLEGADLFVDMLDPDQMEKEIALSIRLDDDIDRKIKRLIQLKVAKQIFQNTRKNPASEPKLINAVSASPPVPAISEMVQDPATPIELEVLAHPRGEDDATTAVAALVVGETDSRERDSAPIAPDIIENEQLVEDPAKVEVFAKPKPLTLAELQRYSVLCEELRERHGYPREPGLASWF